MQNKWSKDSAIADIKKKLMKLPSFSPAKAQYWSAFLLRSRKSVSADMAKNIKVYEARLSRYGIIIQRRTSSFALHWFVLGYSNKYPNSLVIYHYILDLFSFKNPLKRQNPALSCEIRAVISNHCILRMTQRHYKSPVDAVYWCAKTLIHETVKLFDKLSDKHEEIKSYSETEIYCVDDSGILFVGFQPVTLEEIVSNDSMMGVLFAKTYISKSMTKSFNHKEVANDYYHTGKVGAEKMLNALNELFELRLGVRKLRDEAVLRKRALEMKSNAFDLAYFHNALNKIA